MSTDETTREPCPRCRKMLKPLSPRVKEQDERLRAQHPQLGDDNGPAGTRGHRCRPRPLTRFHLRVRDDLAAAVRSMIKPGESLTEHPDETEEERRALIEAGGAELAAKVKPREGVAFTVATFDDGIVALIRRIVYASGGNDRTPLRGIEVSLATEAAP